MYLLLLFLLLPGCSSVHTGASPSSPVFVPDPGDVERYQALVHRQQKMFPDCAEPGVCAHGHFTRGLAALFEDRDVATKHFEEVMKAAPNSRMASSSKLWIKLIRDQRPSGQWNRLLDSVRHGERSEELLAWSTEQLVRDLLEREIIILQILRQKQRDAVSLRALRRELGERGKDLEQLAEARDALKGRTVKTKDPSVRKLRRQVAVRDKRIEELSKQLEALKRIDQEMRGIGN